MDKYKLDEEVEDIVQHYGVKGMKWGTKRAVENSAGGDGEEPDDKLKAAIEAIEKKLGDVSDTMKKKGKSILTSLFGKGKPTYKKATPNAQLTKQYRDAMKKSNLSSKERNAIDTAKRESKIRSEKAMSSNQKTDAILAKYKKQGYKKHAKSKKTLAERGYTFRTDSKK